MTTINLYTIESKKPNSNCWYGEVAYGQGEAEELINRRQSEGCKVRVTDIFPMRKAGS